MGSVSSQRVDRSTRVGELLLSLDRTSSETLRRQLELELREAIARGALPVGSVLPSTRALADQLGVSRGVVTDAYDQLAAQGFIRVRRAVAPRVAATMQQESAELPENPAPRIRLDLRATLPATSLFPRRAWLRGIQYALGHATDDDLGYGDPRGSLELRKTIVSRLNQARGTRAIAANALIVNGYIQALDLLFRTLKTSGIQQIGIEDPSLDVQRFIARRAGLEVVPLRVDADGVDISRLVENQLGAVVLGPAHQFPTGAVLAPDRRRAVADWANQTGSLIIEDDYDAEFRYDRKPIGTLQGLASEHVAYVGTASKSLTPALRLAWMVAPAHLVAPLAEAKLLTDAGAAFLDQLALSHLISSGAFDKHLRRCRSEYRRRRDAVTDTLKVHFPRTPILGAAAGLHLVLPLPAGTDEHAIVELAGERGVALQTLGEMRILPDPNAPGLVIGYGQLHHSRASAAVAEVLAILSEVRQR